MAKSEKVERKEEKREKEMPVAIKVLHPGTVQAMKRDMLLMRYAAYWMDWLHPDFHWVALKECFSEFSIVMRKQVHFSHFFKLSPKTNVITSVWHTK